MYARNKTTGVTAEIYFIHGDHMREYCYASDVKSEGQAPNAHTSNYEIIPDEVYWSFKEIVKRILARL